MRLGLHVSVREGPLAALKTAEGLGLEAVQMLSYRRRPARPGAEGFRWEAPDAAEADELRRARRLGRLIVHVRYLPFLASSDAARRRSSAALLARELSFARLLGADELIVHLGAYSPGAGAAEGTRRFAEGVGEALGRAGGGPPLVVENVPGGGRRMGGTLEELAALREALAARDLEARVCLDTAHAWAAGYDVASARGMEDFLDRAAGLFGARDVAVFHLNDTMAERGSHREHHWHWGQGRLGAEGLRRLLARPDFAHASGILETPPGRDAENLRWVRDLLRLC